MKKRALAILLAASMIGSSAVVFAAEEGTEATGEELIVCENDPDFSTMSIDEWLTYEFNEDYATVISDVTSFDHEFLREFLDKHWSTYLALYIPEIRTATEEEARAMLTELHNMRVKALEGVDVEEKRIYLWGEGNVPTVTEYAENTGHAYVDEPGFEPYMMEMLLDEGVEAKGAVVLSAGGGHMYRSNVEETYEVAQALNDEGYHCFIVNYRIDPYSDEESAIDIARAVKIVRANAEKYGIEEDHIATAGFSYGGIVTSLAADIYSGDTNASVLDPNYVPDEIDAVSSDMNAYLAIYSVVPDEITNEDFPATFFCVGGDDGIWDWVMSSIDECQEHDVRVEIHTMSGVPHGYGAGTYADGTVYENASMWPELADIFMQDVYTKADMAEAAPVEEVSTEEAAE